MKRVLKGSSYVCVCSLLYCKITLSLMTDIVMGNNEVCLSMGNNESEDEESNALSNALNEGREWTKQE